MKISAISWAGVQTSDFDATIRYFSEAVGLPLTLRNDEAEWAHFRLESGDLFEVFGPNNGLDELHACPVFGFEVGDIVSARGEMKARGVEFVTETRTWEDEAWCQFRGPDEYLYQIKQTGLKGTSEQHETGSEPA